MVKIEQEVNRLSKIEQIAIDWQYRRSGDFYTTLMKAIALADETNLDKLAESFPLHVMSYRNFTTVNGWWQKVQEKAYKLGLIAGID